MFMNIVFEFFHRRDQLAENRGGQSLNFPARPFCIHQETGQLVVGVRAAPGGADKSHMLFHRGDLAFLCLFKRGDQGRCAVQRKPVAQTRDSSACG